MARENKTNVKQRAARIPLDSFRRRSVLERSKQWLAGLAVLAGIGYVAFSAFGGPAAVKYYSPGELSAAHRMWENRCDACHDGFVPLSSGAWTGGQRASDLRCQNCHQGAKHSHKQIAAEVADCAACHHEHKGPAADIVRTVDQNCTVCHADIKAHTKQPDEKPFDPALANVTSFLIDHPDFRSTKRSDKAIKFSHSLHMWPGVSRGRGGISLNDLSPTDRERYKKPGQTGESLVTLDCGSCHRLENGSQGIASSSGVRAAGDYMQPIQFDAQCVACHRLTIDGATKLAVQPGPVVPHGVQGEELSKAVTQMIAAKLLEGAGDDLQKMSASAVANEPLEKLRLPNRRLSTDQQASTIGEFLRQEKDAAAKRLKLQCRECHEMKSNGDAIEVQDVKMHPAWFEHAKFDHAAHRAVTCESCHSGAAQKDLPTESTLPLKILDSEVSPEVFIPGRQLCLNCHSPATGEGAAARGGARFDCAECHRYHNGDDPWHGKGSPARGVKTRVPIEDFINGEAWKAKPSKN